MHRTLTINHLNKHIYGAAHEDHDFKKESKQHANIAWCEETFEDKASQYYNTL